jgi:CubicO group peptidase (beta-lactamase class C family)
VQGLSIGKLRSGLVLVPVMLFMSACASAGIVQPIAPTPLAVAPTATQSASATAPATLAPSNTTVPPTATATAIPPTATLIPAPTRTPTTQPSPTVVAQPFDPALAAELQRILDALVADGSIPGAVLAVQIPGQEPWSGASGLADRQRGLPMEPNTHVRIASISKVYTAVVVLQLVEEGLISLDMPMTTWLPDLVPNGDAITVRNLLNHTTGLYDYVEDRHFIGRGYQKPDHAWKPGELVAYTTQFPGAFAPGAEGAWDYSSTNYVILGMIVEQVTGNTLGQEMHRRIFAPLHLENTFFAPEDEVQGGQAHGYYNTTDQTNISMSIVFATANIVSTVGEVRRFGQALNNGELLRPETLDLMYQFVNGKGQYHMPELAYGNGIMHNRLAVGPGPDGQPRPAAASTVVGHIGGFGGFRSALWTAPESGITVALAVNQAATNPNILATQVFDAILKWQGR